MDYKAHLFQDLGKGKLHPSRMQCGRNLFRNGKGTMAVKLNTFNELYKEDKDNVCSKCFEWAKKNNKIN